MAENENPAIDTQSPEFKAAVAAALEGILPDILQKFANARPAPSVEADAVDSSVFDKLAMSIAQLTDQGTGQKRIAPEVIAKRASERARMGELIMKAREAGKMPLYRAVNKLYLHERLIQPYRRENNVLVPVLFGWDGVPSEYMYPMDKDAEEIFQAFLNSIGSTVDAPNAMDRPIWATPGGLVVQGEAPASLKQVNQTVPKKFADNLDLRLPSDPNADEVHILGTIAPPAKTNKYDRTDRRAA